MLAIIIEEKDVLALLSELELAKFSDPYNMIFDRYPGITASDRQHMMNEIHRAFHYRVVRWLQDQGARCVR